MYGAFDIDSMPPATATSRSPARTAWSTIPAERSPEAHTLLTVSDETSLGMPALICAWRLGIWPCPACSTCPKTTCSTCSGATSARSSAAAMAVPPRSVASREARPPPIFPNGVRAAPRITVLGICGSPLRGSKTISTGYVARRRLSMRRLRGGARLPYPHRRPLPLRPLLLVERLRRSGQAHRRHERCPAPARPGIAGDVHRLDRVRAEAAESRAQQALHGRLPR